VSREREQIEGHDASPRVRAECGPSFPRASVQSESARRREQARNPPRIAEHKLVNRLRIRRIRGCRRHLLDRHARRLREADFPCADAPAETGGGVSAASGRSMRRAISRWRRGRRLRRRRGRRATGRRPPPRRALQQAIRKLRTRRCRGGSPEPPRIGWQCRGGSTCSASKRRRCAKAALLHGSVRPDPRAELFVAHQNPRAVREEDQYAVCRQPGRPRSGAQPSVDRRGGETRLSACAYFPLR